MLKQQLLNCMEKLASDSGLSLSEFINYSENKLSKNKSVFPEIPIIINTDSKIYVSNLKVMLAQNLYKDSKVVKMSDALSKKLNIDDPPIGWYASEKWDGIRAIWDGKQFISRGSNVGNPKVYTYVPEWFEELMPPGIALDGEMWISRGEFSRVSSLSNLKPGSKLNKKEINSKWDSVVYKVFDLPGNTKPFEERMKFLQRIIEDRKNLWEQENDTKCPLHFTEQVKIESMEQLVNLYTQITKAGAEGVMLRAPGSPYELKRSKYLLKYKIKEDSEAIVKEYIPGEGRLKGLLGSLRCELLIDSKLSGIIFNIGTGLSDEQRKRYSEKNTEFSIPIGSVVSFSYMELSKDSVPRHPVYRGLRHDYSVKSEYLDVPELTVPGLKIIGIQFKKLKEYGDFNWMINQSTYSNSLFIYNDDTESKNKYTSGKGNAIIRPYNQNNPDIERPRSVGIPTGTRKTGGFNELNKDVKDLIDFAVENVKDIAKKYNYSTIYYSADSDGRLGTGIFKVNKEVIDYITKKIKSLNDDRELIIYNFNILVQGLESSKESNWQFKKKTYNEVIKILTNSEHIIDTPIKCLNILVEGGILEKEEEYYNKHKEWKSKVMQKIDQIIKTGNLSQVNKYLSDPKVIAISELTKIPEIGPAAADKLYSKGIKNISDLIIEFKKDPDLLNSKQEIGLKYYKDLEQRIPREEMNSWNEFFKQLMEKTINEMKKKPNKYSIELVGSYRRKKETSGDIDVLISSDKYKTELMTLFKNNLYLSDITNEEMTFSSGNTKYMGIGKIKTEYRHIDIFYYSEKEYPFALLFSTGSGNFNIEMRKHANKNGYSLSEKELKYLNKQSVSEKDYLSDIKKKYPETEEDIFKYLGLKYIKPEDRH